MPWETISTSYSTTITRTSYNGASGSTSSTSTRDYLDSYQTFREEKIDRPDTRRDGRIWFENRGKSIILTGHKVGSSITDLVDSLTLLHSYHQLDDYNRIIKIALNESAGKWRPFLYLPSLPSIPDFDSLVQDLKAAAHNEALGSANSSEWDLSTFFAEAPETVAYIGGKLNDAYNALRKLGAPKRHTGRPKIKRKKDRISDTNSQWMQYRYAISPMAYDIQDATAALAFLEHKFRTARGSARDDDSISSTRTVGNAGIGLNAVQVQSWSIKAMSSVYSIFTAEQERKLQTQLWLPQTAWELVKLSFVIDWFIGIGDVISALRPVFYQQRAATDSLKVVYQSTVHFDTENPVFLPQNVRTDNLILTGPNASLRYKDAYERSLSSLNLVLPPVQASLNWKRCLDSFALSWPTLKRGFRAVRKWFL
jgi:hypothetical protein